MIGPIIPKLISTVGLGLSASNPLSTRAEVRKRSRDKLNDPELPRLRQLERVSAVERPATFGRLAAPGLSEAGGLDRLSERGCSYAVSFTPPTSPLCEPGCPRPCWCSWGRRWCPGWAA